MTDPFLQPTLDGARGYLTSKGFTTATYKVYPVETTDFTPIASANTGGIMVPNTWYPGETFYQNSAMVAEYLKLFGSASGINNDANNISADVAEAFSAGQVLQQAVDHVGSTDNAKLQTY